MPSARRADRTDIAIIEDRDPWERQPKETEKAFEAFQIYRDMGVTRSLTRLAETLHGSYPKRYGTVQSARATAGAWAGQWAWQRRLEALNLHTDAVRRAEADDRRREMEASHQQLADSLKFGVLARLRGLRGRGEGLPDIEALDPASIETYAEAAQVAKTVVQIDRLNAGLPTDLTKSLGSWSNQEVQTMLNGVLDRCLGRMSDEEKEGFLLDVQTFIAGVRG